MKKIQVQRSIIHILDEMAHAIPQYRGSDSFGVK